VRTLLSPKFPANREKYREFRLNGPTDSVPRRDIYRVSCNLRQRSRQTRLHETGNSSRQNRESNSLLTWSLPAPDRKKNPWERFRCAQLAGDRRYEDQRGNSQRYEVVSLMIRANGLVQRPPDVWPGLCALTTCSANASSRDCRASDGNGILQIEQRIFALVFRPEFRSRHESILRCPCRAATPSGFQTAPIPPLSILIRRTNR
jgi:hypothetical protein